MSKSVECEVLEKGGWKRASWSMDEMGWKVSLSDSEVKSKIKLERNWKPPSAQLVHTVLENATQAVCKGRPSAVSCRL